MLDVDAQAIESALRTIFTRYATSDAASNADALSSAKWSKLVREAKLINAALTVADADLIFVRLSSLSRPPKSKPAPSTKKGLGYTTFLDAVYALACKRSGASDGRSEPAPNGERD
jgi:hypothetical protein